MHKNKANESQINDEIAEILNEAKISEICSSKNWSKRKERLKIVDKILTDSKNGVLSPITTKKLRSP